MIDNSGKRVAWRKKNRTLKNDAERETAIRRFATACINNEQTSVAERCPVGIVLQPVCDPPPPTPELEAVAEPEVETDGRNVCIQVSATTPVVETAVDAYDFGQFDIHEALLEITAKQQLNESLITRESARADRAEQELQRLKTVLSEHSSMLAVSNQTAINALPIQQQMVKTFTSEKQKILDKISEMESLCLAVSAASRKKANNKMTAAAQMASTRSDAHESVGVSDFSSYLSPRNIKVFDEVDVNIKLPSAEKKPPPPPPSQLSIPTPSELLRKMTRPTQQPTANLSQHPPSGSRRQQPLLTPEFVSAHVSTNTFNDSWRMRAFPGH